MAELLLEHGASMSTTNSEGSQPLHLAVEFGHAAVVAALLRRGAPVSAARPDGVQPLHLAAEKGHDALAATLLQHGASIDVTAKDGWTPLLLAIHRVHPSTAEVLLAHGASATLGRHDGTTPLHISARYAPGLDDTASLVRALLARGANVDAATKDGSTALHNAVRAGRAFVADALLEEGATADVPTADYLFTSLRFVAEMGFTDVADSLLKHGASVFATDAFGATAMHVASYFGHSAIVRLLIKHGAQEDAEALLQRADGLAHREEPESDAIYQKVISLAPSDARAYLRLGDVRVRRAAAKMQQHDGHSTEVEPELPAAAMEPYQRAFELLRPRLGFADASSFARDRAASAMAGVGPPPKRKKGGHRVSLADLSVDVAAGTPDAMRAALTIWRRYGVVVFPGLLSSPGILDQVRRHVQEAISARDAVDRSLSIRSARFRTLRSVSTTHISAMISEMGAMLGGFIAAAFGDEQLLLESGFMVTAPGAEDQEFHSDVSNFDPRLASVQISLVDTAAAQGALEVRPASHRNAQRVYTADGIHTAGSVSPPVVVAVPAGTVTFYSPSLVHRGRANTHQRERRFVGLTLMGAGGIVPSGIPYAVEARDIGRWWLNGGRLRDDHRTGRERELASTELDR